MLDIGASGVRYILLAPESTMAVRRLSILRWRRLESFRSHFAVTLLPGGSGGKLGGGVGLVIVLDSKAAKETLFVTFTLLLSK